MEIKTSHSEGDKNSKDNANYYFQSKFGMNFTSSGMVQHSDF